MTIEQRVDLRLTQKLALTPQLQMQLKLLQLHQLELSQYLQMELMENPFLELEEEDQFFELERPIEDREPLVIDKIEKIIIDDYFSERADDGRDLGYFNRGIEEKPNFELFYSKRTDLWEHLLWQLRLSNADDRVRQVAEIVIGNIDEDGYLRASDEEILKLADNADLETVKAAVSLVQEFDPPGVGARDLKECLLLQLRALSLENSVVVSIITDHLEDVQRKKYEKLCRRFNLSLEDILNAIKIIEKLEPRPGRNFSVVASTFPIPDVYVNKIENEYQIILNDEGIPKIRLNNFYKEMVRAKIMPSEEKKFLKEKFRDAIELLKGLEQRHRTIYRVTESIIKFQRDFFEKGIDFIKPLNLRDISEDLGLHESTISRVTTNKYLACDHGVFSFKFFFTNALPSKTGTISTLRVKELIRKLIDEENQANPLSDSEIAEILKKEGIDIARRTVAKYREELKIPSKALRGIKK